jgi:hypothetical protein
MGYFLATLNCMSLRASLLSHIDPQGSSPLLHTSRGGDSEAGEAALGLMGGAYLDRSQC